MSEPDSPSRRQPPTIDLTAKEIGNEKPVDAKAADAKTADPKPAEPRGERGDSGPPRMPNARMFGAHSFAPVVGAIFGALVMLALFAALWIADLLPDRGVGPSLASAPPVSAVVPPAGETVPDKTEPQPAPPARQRQETNLQAVVAARLGALEGSIKALAASQNDSLSALARRVDDVAVAAREAESHADAANSEARHSDRSADVDTLMKRIAVLEEAVKSLGSDVAQRPVSSDDRAARLAVAAGALRATVERGASYEAELGAVKALGADDGALAALTPFAADGVPGAAALARELTALIPALSQAAGFKPGEGSILDRFAANAQKLVRITPLETPRGDDPAAVMARLELAASHNDIDAALNELAKLPEAARMAAASVIGKAQARQKAIAAARQISATALAALQAPVAQ
jgi:hypothetical protein